MKKKFCFTIIFVITLISFVGCDSDDNTTDKSITDPSIPDLSKEDLIGAWDVAMINGLTPQEFLESPNGEDQEEVEITIEKFNFIFSDDNSWTINLEFASVFDFPDNLHDPELVPPDGMVFITGEWVGTFSIENEMLSLIVNEADVNVLTDPQDYLMNFEGQTIPEAEIDFIEDFKNDFLMPFALSTATPQSNTLTLITTVTNKIVLERQ